MEYKDSLRAIKAKLRSRMKTEGLTISELARRTGRKKEALRRLLNTQQIPRLDTFLGLCDAVGIDPASLFLESAERSKNPRASDWALPLTHATRWDDRLSTAEERRARLIGAKRHRYIASILDDVPPDEYWRDLDLAGLQSEYESIRPYLRMMRPFFDAMLDYTARTAA